jgi:predicted subunit of tRNA(5-methylaminomethyl-2-thiouridylate) methyltransferase
MNKLADSMGDAMQDAEALSGKMEIINRILLTQEKIAQRNKELEDSMFFEFNVGDDSELKKLEEQLASLEARLRTVTAIEKDNIETQKKEAEMYGFVNESVKQKNNALEKAKKVMEDLTRKEEFNRKIMFLSNKERKAEIEFEKIAAQIRKDVPDPVLQAKAISEARKKHFEELKNITEETIRFEKIQKAVNDVTGIATKQFDDLSRNLAKAFVDGSKEALNFKSILKSLATDLIKMTLDLLVFNSIKEGVMEIGRNIGGAIATGPKKSATGGAVSPKMPTLVGERGPELFVPNQAGRIVPSSLTPGAMSSSGGVVVNQNLNFSTGISNTVKAEILTLMPQIQNQTISAVAEARMRGGKFAKAFK